MAYQALTARAERQGCPHDVSRFTRVIHTGRGGVRDRILDPTPAFPRTAAISYLTPLLAVIVGILHASLSPVIVIGGVKPDLVLVTVVLVTVLVGFLPGVTWAFVAGLTANLLVGAPLGSVPLTMLLVAVLSTGGGRVLGRLVWVYPVLAVLVGSIVADLAAIEIGQLVTGSAVVGIPLDLILAAAILNAAIAALLVYPVRMLLGRWAPDELPAW